MVADVTVSTADYLTSLCVHKLIIASLGCNIQHINDLILDSCIIAFQTIHTLQQLFPGQYDSEL